MYPQTASARELLKDLAGPDERPALEDEMRAYEDALARIEAEARADIYVIVEGGLARVVDDTGQERTDVLVIDWDVIEQADADELRGVRADVSAHYHAKDRAAVLGTIDERIALFAEGLD